MQKLRGFISLSYGEIYKNGTNADHHNLVCGYTIKVRSAIGMKMIIRLVRIWQMKQPV